MLKKQTCQYKNLSYLVFVKDVVFSHVFHFHFVFLEKATVIFPTSIDQCNRKPVFK